MSCPDTDSICFIAGDDLFYDIKFTENDETIPKDLTGATAKMDLRSDVTDVAVTQSMSGGIIEPLLGQMRFTLTDVETASLLPRADPEISFVFSVKITYQDLSEETILTGTLELKQAATE